MASVATSVRRPAISHFWREILKHTDSLQALLALGAHPARVFTTVTTTYVVTLLDDIILANDTGGGAFTVTLPDAVLAKNRQFTIKKIDANVTTITIATTGSGTLDGMATDVYSCAQQYNMVTYASDGTNYHNVGAYFDAA